MEGGSEKQNKGQLRPHGSRHHPDQMSPHRTPGKTKEGRTVLPLRGPRAYVEGLPKENQAPPYTKGQVATTQPTATTLTEAATTQMETDEEKVNRLVAELKGLNDDIQDKVLNGVFVGQEDF